MAKRSLQQGFCEEAEERFGFLLAAGFEEPTMELGDYGDATLSYQSDAFTVRVSLVWRDGVQVSVMLGRPRFPPPLSCGLDCLYREAGLGPVNWIKHIATSHHSLRRAVGANAQALEELLPTLLGPRFDELMECCKGR